MADQLERISVIVPRNPFTPPSLGEVHHFLCALDVVKLMEWWPGLPHVPKKDLLSPFPSNLLQFIGGRVTFNHSDEAHYTVESLLEFL